MRIIAGSARGRKFDAPPGMDTRPTLDRVKEAMFGMLQFDIPESSVLDLFSGSGNLGFEAASRGAARVLCNDHNRACTGALAENARKLGLDEIVSVTNLDYAACIQRLAARGERFDFVFIDAPYADGAASIAAAEVERQGVLAQGGRIILEHASALPPQVDNACLAPTKTSKYGACSFTVFERR